MQGWCEPAPQGGTPLCPTPAPKRDPVAGQLEATSRPPCGLTPSVFHEVRSTQRPPRHGLPGACGTGRPARDSLGAARGRTCRTPHQETRSRMTGAWKHTLAMSAAGRTPGNAARKPGSSGRYGAPARPRPACRPPPRGRWRARAVHADTTAYPRSGRRRSASAEDPFLHTRIRRHHLRHPGTHPRLACMAIPWCAPQVACRQRAPRKLGAHRWGTGRAAGSQTRSGRRGSAACDPRTPPPPARSSSRATAAGSPRTRRRTPATPAGLRVRARSWPSARCRQLLGRAGRARVACRCCCRRRRTACLRPFQSEALAAQQALFQAAVGCACATRPGQDGGRTAFRMSATRRLATHRCAPARRMR